MFEGKYSNFHVNNVVEENHPIPNHVGYTYTKGYFLGNDCVNWKGNHHLENN